MIDVALINRLMPARMAGFAKLLEADRLKPMTDPKHCTLTEASVAYEAKATGRILGEAVTEIC